MAVIFMDGFDYYQGGANGGAFTGDMGKRWTAVTGISGPMIIGAAYARAPSGQGLYIPSGASSPYPSKSFGANYVSGLLGFAFQATAAFASKTIATILDGTTEQISVRTNASTVLIVSQAGTTKATGTTVLTTGIWYYIELKFTINNTTGVVELHLNGATEIASTGSLNTRGTANNYWNGFSLLGTNQFGAYFDDVYALDTTSGANTTFLGPVQVVLRPMSTAGNYSQFTPNGGTNLGCVSEIFEDGDTSFNMSSTANQIDTFTTQDLPAAAGSVYALQPVIVARQDTGAARTIAPLLRISGSDYVGTTQSLSTSYQFLTQIYDLQPVGGTPAWDVATVNALEVGYKLIS